MYGDTCGVENHTSNNVCDTLVTKHVILLYCTVSCMLGFFLGCCAIQSECESSAYWNPLAAWRVIKMAESNHVLALRSSRRSLRPEIHLRRISICWRRLAGSGR